MTLSRLPRAARALRHSLALLVLCATTAVLLPRRVDAQTRRAAFTERLDSLVLAELARTKTPGVQVAVVVDGALAYERGFGVADIETGRVVTKHTLFRVGSVSKMITAATLAQLASDGKLDLQAPIGQYVPELASPRLSAVTTHQLLTHSAGWLDNAVAYGRADEAALGEVFRAISDTLFFTEPGRVISYSNPGYSMAGYIAERAGDARFADLAERFVLRRGGMSSATFRPLEVMTRDFSQGHVGAPANPGAVVRPYTENTAQWAAGFLFSTAGEFANFAIMLMNGGAVDGNRVLAEEAVARLTTGHQAVPGDATARYGYGLMIDSASAGRMWSHGGSINGFDAQVTMFPDYKLAVVVFDNRSGNPLRGITDLVVAEVIGVEPEKPDAPPADREPTAAERAQLIGSYAQGRRSLLIFEEDGKLKGRQGPVTMPILMRGDDRIALVPPVGEKQTLLLVRDADGRAAYLHQALRAYARQN